MAMSNERARDIIGEQKRDFLDKYLDYGGIAEAYDRSIIALYILDYIPQMKKEIKQQFEGCYLDDSIDDFMRGEHFAYQNALDIIDKYTKVDKMEDKVNG